MKGIGGNITATIQMKETERNLIGESVESWVDVHSQLGWIDFISGDSPSNFNTKLQESTHVFISDYFNYRSIGLTSDNSRMIVGGEVFQIMLIDDPMEMHEQIEILLKYIGGGLNG